MVEWVCVLKTLLRNWKIVHSLQHFHAINFMCSVVHIHLCGIKEAKLEVEGVIFGVYLIRRCVAGKEGVEVVIGAICKSKEVL